MHRSGLLHRSARIIADHLPVVQRNVNRLESMTVRRLGRSLVSVVFGTPVLVLDTIGCRTGRHRSTPLAYGKFALADSDAMATVIVGGAAGQQRVPDWVANLRGDGRATITIDGIAVPVVARELVGDERASLWPALLGQWPFIADYERHACRLIPVFVLGEPEVSGVDRQE